MKKHTVFMIMTSLFIAIVTMSCGDVGSAIDTSSSESSTSESSDPSLPGLYTIVFSAENNTATERFLYRGGSLYFYTDHLDSSKCVVQMISFEDGQIKESYAYMNSVDGQEYIAEDMPVGDYYLEVSCPEAWEVTVNGDVATYLKPFDASNHQGCCSGGHDGVAGCRDGVIICNDGQDSPTCRCDGEESTM